MVWYNIFFLKLNLLNKKGGGGFNTINRASGCVISTRFALAVLYVISMAQSKLVVSEKKNILEEKISF